MPEPVAAPCSSCVMLPWVSTRMTGGGTVLAVFLPLPASRSPSLDHNRMSPPPTVRMRDWLTSMSSRVKPLMSPLADATTPSGPGDSTRDSLVNASGVLARPTTMPPPGTSRLMSPPRAVLMRLANRLISPL